MKSSPLRSFNTFGTAVITEKSVIVEMFTFTKKGEAFDFLKKYTAEQPIHVEKTIRISFACNLIPGIEPEFIMTSPAKNIDMQKLSEESRLVDFLFMSIADLIDKLGMPKTEGEYLI